MFLFKNLIGSEGIFTWIFKKYSFSLINWGLLFFSLKNLNKDLKNIYTKFIHANFHKPRMGERSIRCNSFSTWNGLQTSFGGQSWLKLRLAGVWLCLCLCLFLCVIGHWQGRFHANAYVMPMPSTCPWHSMTFSISLSLLLSMLEGMCLCACACAWACIAMLMIKTIFMTFHDLPLPSMTFHDLLHLLVLLLVHVRGNVRVCECVCMCMHIHNHANAHDHDPFHDHPWTSMTFSISLSLSMSVYMCICLCLQMPPPPTKLHTTHPAPKNTQIKKQHEKIWSYQKVVFQKLSNQKEKF